ncbi:hypothetical protein VTL71DRAFT_9120 [Oculimacula yallundae]|uniref:Yippee domain-containing protein n=1 Tax=Oculimacula yallundae TaxID=86028 RepID=A0ABR4BTX6_9HELO
MPFFRRVCAILHISKNERAKFNFNENTKWLDKGSEGYITEGFVGHYTCPNCTSTINAYRSVLQTTTITHDYLRFEQGIEGSSGRCVMQVPITFEAEFVAMEKEKKGGVSGMGKDGKGELGLGCKCEVVKESFFACCRCVVCGKNLAFWNQVKRCEEVGRMRWFLARKDDKVVVMEEEKLGEEEWVVEK